MGGALAGCALRRGKRKNTSLGESAAKLCPSRIALPFDDIYGFAPQPWTGTTRAATPLCASSPTAVVVAQRQRCAHGATTRALANESDGAQRAGRVKLNSYVEYKLSPMEKNIT